MNRRGFIQTALGALAALAAGRFSRLRTLPPTSGLGVTMSNDDQNPMAVAWDLAHNPRFGAALPARWSTALVGGRDGCYISGTPEYVDAEMERLRDRYAAHRWIRTERYG